VPYKYKKMKGFRSKGQIAALSAFMFSALFIVLVVFIYWAGAPSFKDGYQSAGDVMHQDALVSEALERMQ